MIISCFHPSLQVPWTRCNFETGSCYKGNTHTTLYHIEDKRVSLGIWDVYQSTNSRSLGFVTLSRETCPELLESQKLSEVLKSKKIAN